MSSRKINKWCTERQEQKPTSKKRFLRKQIVNCESQQRDAGGGNQKISEFTRCKEEITCRKEKAVTPVPNEEAVNVCLFPREKHHKYICAGTGQNAPHTSSHPYLNRRRDQRASASILARAPTRQCQNSFAAIGYF